MKTDLETMIGYLAGREGGGAARLRAEMDDPSSESSRFLEATRRRTRSLVSDALAEKPRPARSPRRPRSIRTHPAAAAALLVFVSAAVPIGIGQVRERRLQAALARSEADAKEQAGRLAMALASPRPIAPRPEPHVLPMNRDEPIALALNRVEQGLGQLERRIDGLTRPATAPAATEMVAPQAGPDPSLAEIRAEMATIRRESAAGELATARQLQEMRTVLQEVNQIVRRAVMGRPQGGGPVPMQMPMMMPGNIGAQNFGPNGQGIDASQVQAIVNNLSSPHSHVRLEAAETLANLGQAGRLAVPNLQQMIHHESDARVRAAAQAALSHLQPK